MIKNGVDKIYPHKDDYSFIPTFGATVFDTAGLPSAFTIYNGETIPNQEFPDARFDPMLPQLPMGCTGEATAFICGLEDGALYNPLFTYMQTPPRDNGGRDIRAALKSAIDVGVQAADGTVGNKRTAYFNVYAAGAIDDFDACRIAIWITQNEKRAVSVGSYWYWSIAPGGILPTPSFDTSKASMHNYIIVGWKIINGVQYLIGIPWIGQTFGDNGLVYFSRELFNAIINQPYTGMFTLTKVAGITPISVGYTAVIDHLVAFIKQLFGLNPMTTPPIAPPQPPAPAPSPLLWDTPKQAFHSVRVLCDNAGLSLAEKNVICAVIYQESRFEIRAINRNKNAQGQTTSTDWSLCQINDHYNIGPSKPFPSVQYVLDNPDKAVQWMLDMQKTGKLSLWVGFSSGEYKQWLKPSSPMWLLKTLV